MSNLKVSKFLTFLFLLGILPQMQAHDYFFIEPYERDYLTNFDDDGGLGGGGGGGRYGRSEFECTTEKPKCAPVGTGDPKKVAFGIAQKAALDAKAASDAQLGAAEAASYRVKAELAYKAQQSAKAAEAALAGKQQILDQMRQELTDAETALATIQAAVPRFVENAELLKIVAQKSEKQLSFVKKIVEIATGHLVNDQKVAKGARQEVAEKTALLDAARKRAEVINQRLADAIKDLDATKTEAYKASCAAVEAKQKAQRNRRGSWLYEDMWHYEE